MSSIALDRDKTKLLKGIALIMMLVHHTSTPALWATEGTAWYSFFSFQGSATKMCVWIFAFLVGYGFYFSANKTLKYSFKRILLLIVPFWFMMLMMFIPLSYITCELDNILNMNQMSIGGWSNYLGINL